MNRAVILVQKNLRFLLSLETKNVGICAALYHTDHGVYGHRPRKVTPKYEGKSWSSRILSSPTISAHVSNFVS